MTTRQGQIRIEFLEQKLCEIVDRVSWLPEDGHEMLISSIYRIARSAGVMEVDRIIEGVEAKRKAGGK